MSEVKPATAAAALHPQEIRYMIKTVMLTKATVERGGSLAKAPWDPQQLASNQLALMLNATPRHEKGPDAENVYLVSLPVTAEYRLRTNERPQPVTQPQEPRVDENTLLLVKVEYTGVFEVLHNKGTLGEFLQTIAPTMLFPYASMTINELIAKAGSQPMFLPPLDFTSIKRQAVAQAHADATATRQ